MTFAFIFIFRLAKNAFASLETIPAGRKLFTEEEPLMMIEGELKFIQLAQQKLFNYINIFNLNVFIREIHIIQ